MNKTFVFSLFVLCLLKIKIDAGIPVPKNKLAGKPITASNRFSLITCSRIFPSPPLLNNTPCGTTTPTFPVPSFADSIICVTKAQSPRLFGGTPRQKRLNGSLSDSSFPHFFKENGGLATTTSNFSKLLLLSKCKGFRMVSPQRILALSKPCKNIFITANAQVLPLFSCP